MTRNDIIRMAREAGFESHDISLNFPKELERFAALVASAERERLTDAAMKAAEKAVDVAIALEREACAKVADTISDKYGWGHYGNEVDTADEIAKAIRARGQA